MSDKFKTVSVGRGTVLSLDEDQQRYLSVGKNGKNIILRGSGQVFCFETWEQLVSVLQQGGGEYTMKDTRAIAVNITFEREHVNDITNAEITAPPSVSVENVYTILKDSHDYLCKGDGYKANGYTPATLLNYVCENHDWSWKRLEPAISIVCDNYAI